MARRRNNRIQDFFGGFTDTYNTVGGFLADQEIADLAAQEAQAELLSDRDTFATGMGLRPDSAQAQQLYNQNREFGVGAAQETADALNYTGQAPQASAQGMQQQFDYLGQKFDQRPTQDQKDYARQYTAGDVYQRFGLQDRAQKAREQARTGRRDSMQTEAAGLQLDSARRKAGMEKDYSGATKNLKSFTDYIRGSVASYNSAMAGPMADGAQIGLSDDGKTITYITRDGRVKTDDMAKLYKDPGMRDKLAQNAYISRVAQVDPKLALQLQELEYDAVHKRGMRDIAGREANAKMKAAMSKAKPSDLQIKLARVAMARNNGRPMPFEEFQIVMSDELKDVTPDERAGVYRAYELELLGTMEPPPKAAPASAGPPADATGLQASVAKKRQEREQKAAAKAKSKAAGDALFAVQDQIEAVASPDRAAQMVNSLMGAYNDMTPGDKRKAERYIDTLQMRFPEIIPR